MSLIEKARTALRDWLNKPSAKEEADSIKLRILAGIASKRDARRLEQLIGPQAYRDFHVARRQAEARGRRAAVSGLESA